MKNEKINKALGMLDDDVIADALEEKRGSFGGRRVVTALIAAALAVAILASTVLITRRPERNVERIDITPPVGMTVIKRAASSAAQITAETVTRSGTYPYVQSEYVSVEPLAYIVADGLEMDETLYNALVSSDDVNRTWAIEVQVSPNLYVTNEYLALELESILANVDSHRLEALIGIYEQAKANFDIEALYQQYKDVYEIDELYRYFASGELDRDLLNADIDALGKKASQLIKERLEIREGYWGHLRPMIVSALEKMGVPFTEEDGNLVIFVTESELLSLSGIEGLKFDESYYKIDISEMTSDQTVMREGKKIASKLADAFAEYEGEDVLFAVLVETAGIAESGSREAYVQEYIGLLSEIANRHTLQQALERAQGNGGESIDRAREICGEDAFNRYFREGVFDSELFNSDTAAINARINEMKVELYGNYSAEVYDLFKDHVRYIEITDQGSVIIYVTAAEFDALNIEGDFVFNLAA